MQTTATDESVDKAEQLRVTRKLLDKSKHEVAELRRKLRKKTKDCATAIIEKDLYAHIWFSESLHDERTLGDRAEMIWELRTKNVALCEYIQGLKSNHRDFQVILQNHLDGLEVLRKIHWGRVDQLVDSFRLHGIDTSKIKSEFEEERKNLNTKSSIYNN